MAFMMSVDIRTTPYRRRAVAEGTICSSSDVLLFGRSSAQRLEALFLELEMEVLEEDVEKLQYATTKRIKTHEQRSTYQ